MISTYNRSHAHNVGIVISENGNRLEISSQLKGNAKDILSKTIKVQDCINGILYGVVLPENEKYYKVYIRNNLGQKINCIYDAANKEITEKVKANLQNISESLFPSYRIATIQGCK